MDEIRQALIEALKEVCSNCMAEPEKEVMEDEVDRIFMPKIIPIIDSLKQNGTLFKENP